MGDTDKTQGREEWDVRKQHLLDPLTGLPNRALLLDRMDQRLREAARNAQPFSVLLIDVEHFDESLRGFPPDTVDQVLTEIARRMGETLRESDTLARLVGESFAALLPSTHGLMGIHVVAERLGRAVAEPIVVNGESISLNACIGAAQWPEHGEDRHALLRHAGLALAEARHGETWAAVFQGASKTQHGRGTLMVRGLARAIQEQEFVVHYQPQVELASGRVEGVEALVRWHHPELGLLPPMDFIPMAEGSSAIYPLTLQVLEQVLSQAAAWRASGLALPVSVNLSPKVLHERSLVENIVECQQRHDVPAQMLTLEIAESSALGPAQRVARSLQALSMADFRIAIDDFGTGFASLKCLRALPVDEIKIDPLFTAGLGSADRESCIVRAILELARGFDARVIAEGIESERTAELLRALGCSHGQGFYLSPPLPAAECEAWCRRRAAQRHDDGEPGNQRTPSTVDG